MDDTYDVYVNNFSGENNTIGAIELSISNEDIRKKLYLNNFMDKLFSCHAFKISENGIDIINKFEKSDNIL